MKILTHISFGITALLLLATMICGLWMRSQPIVTDSNISFHMNCGIVGICFFFISMILKFFSNRKENRK